MLTASRPHKIDFKDRVLTMSLALPGRHDNPVCFGRRADHVACASHGMNQREWKTVIDLLTQPVHVHVY
jgi:hypothetical protein